MTTLRKSKIEDADDFFQFEKENGDSIRQFFLLPNFTSVTDAANLIKKYNEQIDREFYWVLTDNGAIAGSVALTHIRRGIFQTANLNFFLGSQYTGRGIMTDSVLQIIDIAFKDLCLNRIEAFIHINNEKSVSVVKHAGFQYEGLMRGYLRIDNAWHDHERWAILSSDYLNQKSTS